MKDLNTRAWLGFIFLAVVMGLCFFISAGTIFYWQAWLYLVVFFGCTGAITVYLMKNDPKLLESRVQAGPVSEKESKQKIIQGLASISFLLLLIIPGLDFRNHWSSVPTMISVIGNGFVALGLYIVFLVFRENSFTSAIIEAKKDQKVISTGPYKIIRHPMYSGALLLLVFTPLALASYWGLLAVIPIFMVIVFRLLDEEKFLSIKLEGYKEFLDKTQYRLIPHIW